MIWKSFSVIFFLLHFWFPIIIHSIQDVPWYCVFGKQLVLITPLLVQSRACVLQILERSAVQSARCQSWIDKQLIMHDLASVSIANNQVRWRELPSCRRYALRINAWVAHIPRCEQRYDGENAWCQITHGVVVMFCKSVVFVLSSSSVCLLRVYTREARGDENGDPSKHRTEMQALQRCESTSDGDAGHSVQIDSAKTWCVAKKGVVFDRAKPCCVAKKGLFVYETP